MRQAAESDATNAVPASITKRILAACIAAPLIQIGFWLAWPGLILSRAGHALFVATVERQTHFRKN